MIESTRNPTIQAYEVLSMGGINRIFIDNKIKEFKMCELEKN